MGTTRTFVLYRDQDVTGISGTGPVADGVVFPDGVTVVRWRDLGGPAAERGVRPTTVVFESIEAVEALHGHGGATRIVWGAITSTCKHCGRTIATTRPRNGWVHADGGQHGLNRCNSDDSGLPYGYDAAPDSEPCGLGCLGHTPTPPEPTYRVTGGQGSRDLARGLSLEAAQALRKDFDEKCDRAGLTNPPTRITKETSG